MPLLFNDSFPSLTPYWWFALCIIVEIQFSPFRFSKPFIISRAIEKGYCCFFWKNILYREEWHTVSVAQFHSWRHQNPLSGVPLTSIKVTKWTKKNWFKSVGLSFFLRPMTRLAVLLHVLFILFFIYLCLLPLYVPPPLLFLCVTQPAIPSVPPRFLTSGSWDVTSLCALYEKAGKMYVRATLCGSGSNHTLAPLTARSALLWKYKWWGGRSAVAVIIIMIITQTGSKF